MLRYGPRRQLQASTVPRGQTQKCEIDDQLPGFRRLTESRLSLEQSFLRLLEELCSYVDVHLKLDNGPRMESFDEHQLCGARAVSKALGKRLEQVYFISCGGPFFNSSSIRTVAGTACS